MAENDFKLDSEFESYWPKLSEEKFIILEQSILNEGLRENLVVWKEENILIDGHQRLTVLRKHDIPIDDKITYLSFVNRLHAKRWAHANQTGRRGDVSKFLNVCHVMEFEPIYREEAKRRQGHGKTAPGKTLNPTAGGSVLNKGEATEFMAKDSGVSHSVIERIFYIKKHDKERFEELEKRAKSGEEISVALEYHKIKAGIDAKNKKIELNKNAIEKLPSADSVKAFSEAIQKHKPSPSVQEAAIDTVIKSEKRANENYIEDTIIHRLPKKKAKQIQKTNGLTQIKTVLEEIALNMNHTIERIYFLQEELREQYGDDIYFQAIATTPELQTAFAKFTLAAKSFGGYYDEKNQKQKNLLNQGN